MYYYVYWIIGGNIYMRFQGPLDQLDYNVAEGQSVIAADFVVPTNTHYVVHETGTLHEKADYTLEALPLSCTVTIEGVTYEVTEQPVFEFDLPGTYTIQVDAGPRFLQKEFTIDYQT